MKNTKIIIIAAVTIVVILALLAWFFKSKTPASTTNDKKQNSNPTPTPKPGPVPAKLTADTVTFSMTEGDYYDYYVVLQLTNGEIRVLVDTGSALFVANEKDYNPDNLKTTKGPMNTIQYLGIAGTPKNWYIDTVKNLGNYSTSVGDCSATDAKGNVQNLPSILGLAETYKYAGADTIYNGFINHSTIRNISFDFISNKFTVNDPETQYDYVLPRNKTFTKQFSTSFYCTDLVINGKTTPVVFDTGMSVSSLNAINTVNNLNVSTADGKLLFNIPTSNMQDLPLPNDSPLTNIPFLILSNLVMKYPVGDTTISYKLCFEPDYIKLKLIRTPTKLAFVPTLVASQVKKVADPASLLYRYSLAQ